VSGEALSILRNQIARCKEILSSLSAAAGQVRAEAGASRPLDAWLEELMQRWQSLRPGVPLRTHFDGTRPAPRIVAEQTLAQAITNILNNAADASPAAVEVSGHWTEEELVLEIADRGSGLAPEIMHRAGEPFLSTKGEGLGLGLFLAYTTFNRFGGAVRLLARAGGGTLCRLTLPLAALRVS
jgi:two-component system sensor histidine kinase RegB